MKSLKICSGFTLIELLVVLGITAILAVMTIPFSLNYMNGVRHNRARDEIISLIRKSQMFALNGKGDSTWGICYDNGIVRLYSGTCSNSDYKNEFELSSGTYINGLTDVQFANRTGEPSTALSITIQTGTFSNNISMNSIGGMQIVSN